MPLRNRQTPTTAFVLGGGGAKGAVQVGQLKALSEAGIVPDALFGCSAGALNAAFVSNGFSSERVEALEEVWRGAHARDLFPGGRIERARKLLARHPGLHDPVNLYAMIEEWCPVERLEHATVPLEVVTVNLTRGRCVYHREGDARRIVAASCALPGIYPPVVIDGEDHVDGGVLDVLPWRRAVMAGYERVYVLSCEHGETWQPPRTRSPLGISLSAWQLTRRQLAEIEPHDSVIVLPGASTEGVEANDFEKSPELIEPSFEAAAAELERLARAERRPTWRERLRGHRGERRAGDVVDAEAVNYTGEGGGR